MIQPNFASELIILIPSWISTIYNTINHWRWSVIGGVGSAVAEYLMSSKHSSKLLQLGLPDEFIMQGTQQEMYVELGLDAAGILGKIEGFYK